MTLALDDHDETATWTGSVVRGPDGRWVLLAFENSGPDTDFADRVTDPLPLDWSPGGQLTVARPQEPR